MTLLLTRGDLETVLEPETCLDALRDGFLNADADSVSIAGQRVRTDLPFPGTATALIPGLLPGIPAYTVKVNAKFPAARPALRGVICLHSGTDGALLALMDSATVTAWRTGLAAALGTHLLAGAGEAVGVIGAGAQAELMVRGLGVLRPRGALVVHDTSADRAAQFAARHGGRVLSSAAEIAVACDLVLSATWSREPLLSLADTRPGAALHEPRRRRAGQGGAGGRSAGRVRARGRRPPARREHGRAGGRPDRGGDPGRGGAGRPPRPRERHGPHGLRTRGAALAGPRGRLGGVRAGPSGGDRAPGGPADVRPLTGCPRS
ncbi:ornithine cyclodeaminase/mu-crystallin [Streptomyces sviceus ATCC 29083]|uniref:Ornithine cyclodeaminase/mu-crystallin n=1 Tax=Streptomyces sviceus (strain ATCC 29083 / DSM 924 / JCM 4929 / NBRC 13980 / NCIMB 11184 / NRRL 5439 / UC 5370) TaxID=463191 RepID=B5HSR2_STRX2|nr:ornithine cyclodeaminase/mu-crystallin [Streptomyces sviceus ATCC 29083]